MTEEWRNRIERYLVLPPSSRRKLRGLSLSDIAYSNLERLAEHFNIRGARKTHTVGALLEAIGIGFFDLELIYTEEDTLLGKYERWRREEGLSFVFEDGGPKYPRAFSLSDEAYNGLLHLVTGFNISGKRGRSTSAFLEAVGLGRVQLTPKADLNRG